MPVLVKASAIALITAVCCLLIKSKNPEYSFTLSVICAVVISSATVGMISELSDFVRELIQGSAVSEAVFVPVIKCVGIAVLTKLICELCNDAGQKGTAGAVEYLGCAAAVYTVLPLMQAMLKTIRELT